MSRLPKNLIIVCLPAMLVVLSVGCAGFAPGQSLQFDRGFANRGFSAGGAENFGGIGGLPSDLGSPEQIPDPDDVTAARVPIPANVDPGQGVELLPPPGALEGPQISPPAKPLPSRLELSVKAPQKKQAGSGTVYWLTLKNTTDDLIENIAIESNFDNALVSPGHPGKTLRQIFTRLQPNETREMALTLVSDQVGSHCCRFSVTVDDREEVWKSVCVEFVQKRIDVKVIGPANRTVGSSAEFTIKLVNVSERDLKAVDALLTFAKPLVAKEASQGAVRGEESLKWDLGTLKPGEGVQLQVEFACTAAAEQACLAIAVSGEGFPDEDVETCLRIDKLKGTVALRVKDSVDPLQVDDETEYVVTVENVGLQPKRDLRLTARVPVGLRVVSGSVEDENGQQLAQVQANVQGERITFDSVATLNADAVLTYRIRVKATQPGDVEFVAELTHALSESPIEVREPTTVNR